MSVIVGCVFELVVMSLMFYKGVRIHYKIPTIHSWSSCVFIVSVDRGNRRFFLEFASSDEFEQWYTMLSPEEKTMNEVIVSDVRKLIIDIDDPDDYKLANQLLFYDFGTHVTFRIREVFMVLGIGDPQIIIYDMCDDFKISYHAVVTNFTFDAKTCKGLCMIIASNQIWDKCVDVGVYKTVQSVRVEGSTKYGQHRWKTRTNNYHLPFASGLLSNNCNTTKSYITCNISTHYDHQLKTAGAQHLTANAHLHTSDGNPPTAIAQHQKYVSVSVGVVSVSVGCHTKSVSGSVLESGVAEGYEDTRVLMCPSNVDLSQFKIGKIKNNILPLYRVKPGFCTKCNRIHNRENAAIRYGYNGIPVYICWRYHNS